MAQKHLAAYGSSAPDLYIILDMPELADIHAGLPLSSEVAKPLLAILQDRGLRDRVRVNHLYPQHVVDDRGYKQPIPEYLYPRLVDEWIKTDIDSLDVKPKAIIAMGSAVLKAIVPDFTGAISTAAGKIFDFNGIPVQATYALGYVDRQGGLEGKAFRTLLSQVTRATSLFQIQTRGELEWDMFDGRDLNEVKAFLSKFKDKPVVALDYEGSSLDPLSQNYMVGGIGLSTEDYAAYLYFRDFFDLSYALERGTDHAMAVCSLIRDFLIEQQRERTLTVFNLKYEIPLTKNVFDVFLDNTLDTLQYAKTLNMVGGLKKIAQRYLLVAEWVDAVDDWKKHYDTLIKLFKTSGNKEKKEVEFLREGNTLNDLVQSFKDAAVVKIERAIARHEKALEKGKESVAPEHSPTRKKDVLANLSARQLRIIEAIENISEFIAQSYPESVDMIDTQLTKIVIDRVNRNYYDIDYTEIPAAMVGKYCCLDANYTHRIFTKSKAELESKGILKAANYYNEQMYLGCALEHNGICWNDDKAEKLKEKYLEKTLRHTQELLTLPHVIDALRLSKTDILTINSAVDYDQLKTYFNANSNTAETRQMVNDIMISGRVRVAVMYTVITGEHGGDPERVERLYPTIWNHIEQIKQAESHDRLALLEQFGKSYIELSQQGKLTNAEVKIIGQHLNFALTSTDKAAIQTLFDAFTVFMGGDFDKPESMTPEQTVLFHYRMIKKILKTVGTYIDGSPARGSVYVVRKDELEAQTIRHISPYRRLSAEEVDEFDYLYCPRYGVNSVATRRWSSGAHTIPWESEVRDISRSRFRGGLIIHFDYSQQEMRVMAALAQDENLLQAYRDGQDIHRLVASHVWGKPIEEVTDAERRFAKAASFSLLYGKTLQGFADDMFSGDVSKAQNLFDMFFTAFPRVKEFIDRQHGYLAEHGAIKTIWGDELIIDYDPTDRRKTEEAKRAAQNWGIQSSASSLAAVCLNRVDRYLRENNYRSRLFGFTHDAGEIDTAPDELLGILSVLPELAEKFPESEWGLPVEIDVEIGVTGFQILTLKRDETGEYARREGDYLIVSAKFSGIESAVLGMVESLKPHCEQCDLTIDDTEDEYTPIADLFVTKRGYSSHIGTTTRKVTGSLKIRQYKPLGAVCSTAA